MPDHEQKSDQPAHKSAKRRAVIFTAPETVTTKSRDDNPNSQAKPKPESEVEPENEAASELGPQDATEATAETKTETEATGQPSTPEPLGWRAFGILAFLGGVMVAILGIGWQIWFSVDTQMDPFAWWLIGGALVFSVLLGGGLLALLRYSSRHHDHRVYDIDHFQKWHRR